LQSKLKSRTFLNFGGGVGLYEKFTTNFPQQKDLQRKSTTKGFTTKVVDPDPCYRFDTSFIIFLSSFFRGLTPTEAEAKFLESASRLSTYGFDPYVVRVCVIQILNRIIFSHLLGCQTKRRNYYWYNLSWNNDLFAKFSDSLFAMVCGILIVKGEHKKLYFCVFLVKNF
jgi:hypothetical protein